MTSLSIDTVLKKYGLLCHSFAYNDLPMHIQSKLSDATNTELLNNYLSLVANVGPTFWARLTASISIQNENDPVDQFSKKIADELLTLSTIKNNAELLYPGKLPVPLIQLGELAHWSTPSPLGLGLHSTYGPWLAYRLLIKTSQPLTSLSTMTHQIEPVSPCVSCVSTPCVSACPADAVKLTESFNIGRCADYRVQDDSHCKQQCHARNACPVGVEFQYSEEQRAYHMTHALHALVSWANTK